MDPRQFDALSRTLARGLSRRQAVTRMRQSRDERTRDSLWSAPMWAITGLQTVRIRSSAVAAMPPG